MFRHLWMGLAVVLHSACITPEPVAESCEPVHEVAAEGLKAWLDAGCFETWTSESEVLQATMSDGHAQVFINPVLADSLASSMPEHPVGSAAVRVMYLPDRETVWGYALSVKADHVKNGEWFWFEHFEHHDTPTVSGHDASGCTGCHSGGADFVQSTWPLR